MERSTADRGRALIDKLGVATGMSVAMVGVDVPGLVTAVRGRAGAVATVSLQPDPHVAGRGLSPLEGLGSKRDLIFILADSAETLALLPRLVAALAPAGALWVLWQKGRHEVGQSAVMAAGLSAGVVDVKVVSVSDRHSALKFVFRLKDRAGRDRGRS